MLNIGTNGAGNARGGSEANSMEGASPNELGSKEELRRAVYLVSPQRLVNLLQTNPVTKDIFGAFVELGKGNPMFQKPPVEKK